MGRTSDGAFPKDRPAGCHASRNPKTSPRSGGAFSSRPTRGSPAASTADPSPAPHLSEYADDLLALVDRISAYETYRHFMAHGLMVVNTRETATAAITFRMYRKAKKTPEEFGEIQTDLDQLTNLAREIGEYAHQIVTLVARIVQELSLEPR